MKSAILQQRRIDGGKSEDGIYKTRGSGTKNSRSVDKENARDKRTEERKMGTIQKKRERKTHPRQCRRNYGREQT